MFAFTEPPICTLHSSDNIGSINEPRLLKKSLDYSTSFHFFNKEIFCVSAHPQFCSCTLYMIRIIIITPILVCTSFIRLGQNHIASLYERWLSVLWRHWFENHFNPYISFLGICRANLWISKMRLVAHIIYSYVDIAT